MKKKVKTFADRAKDIEKRYPRAKYDKIEAQNMEAELEALMNEQEAFRSAMGMDSGQQQFAEGGSLYDYLKDSILKRVDHTDQMYRENTRDVGYTKNRAAQTEAKKQNLIKALDDIASDPKRLQDFHDALVKQGLISPYQVDPEITQNIQTFPQPNQGIIGAPEYTPMLDPTTQSIAKGIIESKEDMVREPGINATARRIAKSEVVPPQWTPSGQDIARGAFNITQQRFPVNPRQPARSEIVGGRTYPSIMPDFNSLGWSVPEPEITTSYTPPGKPEPIDFIKRYGITRNDDMGPNPAVRQTYEDFKNPEFMSKKDKELEEKINKSIQEELNNMWKEYLTPETEAPLTMEAAGLRRISPLGTSSPLDKDVKKRQDKLIKSLDNKIKRKEWWDKNKGILPFLGSGLSSLVGNALLAGLTKPQKINPKLAQAEQINLEPQAEQLRREAGVSKNINMRNARNLGLNAGATLGNMGVMNSAIDRQLGNSLTGLYLGQEQFNKGAMNQANLANMSAMNQAEAQNAAYRAKALDDQLGYFGSMFEIPGQVNRDYSQYVNDLAGKQAMSDYYNSGMGIPDYRGEGNIFDPNSGRFRTVYIGEDGQPTFKYGGKMRVKKSKRR